MTDKELIRKVHNGNKEALNTLISSYYDDIYRFCLYLTGQEADSTISHRKCSCVSSNIWIPTSTET